MTLLFGLPSSLLALIFAGVLVAGLLILVGLALRQPVLMKLGLRNIGRRPTQTVLIAIGLLLSTMLITTALGVGDVITGAIRSVAVSSLGRIDELAYASGNQTPFALSSVSADIATLRRDPAIGGAMPIAEADGLLWSDLQSRQTAKADLIGLPARIPPIFGPLHGSGATLVDPATLGSTDVLINRPLAAALAPSARRQTLPVPQRPAHAPARARRRKRTGHHRDEACRDDEPQRRRRPGRFLWRGHGHRRRQPWPRRDERRRYVAGGAGH